MIQRSLGLGILAAGLLLAPGVDTRAQRRGSVQPDTSDVLPVLPATPDRTVAQDRIAKLPPNWIDQLQEMTPPEQDQFLRNNERFRSLPPHQQALIRQRLRAWNALPVNQREAVLERQQIWEQLPPDQRRHVRESLLPKWQSLALPRREVILGKLRQLRGADGAQRAAMLSDESFLGSMNEEDRRMLRELSSLGVGRAPG